jgi:Xaa-Pro aminopeptidase
LSIEPGYYEAGEFGVRLETILEVVKAETKYSLGDDQKFLRFEPISFVPFEPNMIKLDLMTRKQVRPQY